MTMGCMSTVCSQAVGRMIVIDDDMIRTEASLLKAAERCLAKDRAA